MYTKNVFNACLQNGKLIINEETNKNGDIKKDTREYNLRDLLKNCECACNVKERRPIDEDFYDEDFELELDQAEFDHLHSVLAEAIDVVNIIDPEGYNNTAILPDLRELRDACIAALDMFATYTCE